MKMKKPFIGTTAFFIVLLTMPLGHAAVILIEKGLGLENVYYAAVLLGCLGTGLLLAGMNTTNALIATLLGMFGALFVWGGWIEFAFSYYANRTGVQPLMQNGEIITKAEYLIMPSSLGFFAVIMLYYLFGVRSGCRFFLWLQRTLKIDKMIELAKSSRNTAMVTFMEFIVLLWGFYMMLLLAYDQNFAGDRHPVTYFIAFGSALWSFILFVKLIKISQLAYAIRYAIPTVIIFWNFVEILGRWNVFTEVWIEPSNYLLEIVLMVIVLLVLTVTVLFSEKNVQQETSQ
ncbi:hypothetical protein [Prosthecochloris sp.]|uniref:hypothetical protein n=1 Tax=Prosthecochloris sp. TaxID=290513 RepID=UPI0025800AD4|nr:hypothetical protein [Prosthecochloris sp.]